MPSMEIEIIDQEHQLPIPYREMLTHYLLGLSEQLYTDLQLQRLLTPFHFSIQDSKTLYETLKPTVSHVLEQLTHTDIKGVAARYKYITWNSQTWEESEETVLLKVLKLAIVSTETYRILGEMVVRENWKHLQQEALLQSDIFGFPALKAEYIKSSNARLNAVIELIKYGDLLSPRFQIFSPSEACDFLLSMNITNRDIPTNGLLLVFNVPDLFISDAFRRKGGVTEGVQSHNWRRTPQDTQGVLETGEWFTRLLECMWGLRNNILKKKLGLKCHKINPNREHSTGTEEIPRYHYMWLITQKNR